jgi:hypothetical protein
MRAWVLVSALASLAIACSDTSSPAPRTTSGGGASTGTTTGTTSTGTSTGAGAAGGSGGNAGSGGSGGNTTGTGAGGNTGGSGGNTAGSGGSGAVDAGGDDASVDAKPDVGFTWPETVPGLKCKPGHYHGSFTGTYASSAAIIPLPIPVAGDIDLTLIQSAKGEVLEITNGKLSGLANLIFPFSADLIGKLDCKTSKLDPSTALKNGNYIVFGTNYSFEGPFLGDYDKIAAAFVNGTWDVKEPIPIYGGTGSWSANWVSFPDAGGDAVSTDAPADGPQGDVDEGGQ